MYIIPECVAKGSHLLSGGLGAGPLFVLSGLSGRRRVAVGSLIPCPWQKLQNFSFLKISKQDLTSFCVVGIALCDVLICLIMRRKWQNWTKSRTKCSFCCAHVFRLEFLLFLWCRHIYGAGSYVILRGR